MNSIQTALGLKSQLDALRPLQKEDEERIMQKFRLDWNYHSNHLEGNSLTYGETKALILYGITAQGKPLKDHFEITGHNEAIKWILDVVKDNRPLTEQFIRELHKLILKESYEVNAITPSGKPTKKKVEIGTYKKTPNHVKTKTGEIFRFSTPEETPAKMNDLITWYRDKSQAVDLNPILLASKFHYDYIRIHPFDDGNGRTARILMNFILMKHGYPPVIIKTEDKENYFRALQQADAGIKEAFVEYIGKNLVHSLELMIKGAKGESIEEADDLDKELALLEQQFKAIDTSVPFKSTENIIRLYEQSIDPLIKLFYKKAAAFDKFYTLIPGKHILIFDKDKAAFPTKYQDLFKSLNKELSGFRISYEYQYFQYDKDTAPFYNVIKVSLDKQAYKIQDSQNNISFTKNYNQQLSQAEIKQIVDTEMNRHKTILKERLAKIQNNNTK